jgi:hypothetical protein
MAHATLVLEGDDTPTTVGSGLGYGVYLLRIGESQHCRGLCHDTSHIVAVCGTVIEIVYALSVGERLVGMDTSGTYPKYRSSKKVLEIPKASS